MNAARCSLVFVLGAALTGAAHAQTQYPAKPVRLIVPFPPGGGTDTLARIYGKKLGEAMGGQQVIIDNRPGGGTNIGAELAAKAPPDGYTALMGNISHAINATLYSKLNYDFAKDFAPVALLASTPNILVVHPSVPVKTVKELVAFAKAKSAHLTYASGGSGSSPHLSGELFRLVAGIDLTHVPFKGSGPGATALIGGQVTMMFAGPLLFEPHIKSGKLRALAVADRKRSPILPDVPTMAESGFAGIETGTWYGFLAPAGTPNPVVQTFHETVVKVMATPDMKSRLLAQGVDIVGAGPREFDRIIREEVDKWAKLVKRAGITAE